MHPTILLLSDDTDLLSTLRKALKTPQEVHAIETCSFNNAVHALAWCQHNRPSLCFVDSQLPSMNGIAFIRAAFDFFNLKHVPMVLITEVDDLDLGRYVERNGAVEVITRPIDPQQVLAPVARLLGKRLVDVEPTLLRDTGFFG